MTKGDIITFGVKLKAFSVSLVQTMSKDSISFALLKGSLPINQFARRFFSITPGEKPFCCRK